MIKYFINNFYFFQGCQEKTDNFIPNSPDWSAIRNSDYGYGRLKIYNSTHLHVEQVSDDRVRMLYNIYRSFTHTYSGTLIIRVYD